VRRYVIDTNVYIRATRDDGWSQALENFFLAFSPEIHLHSVVAMEILAGATTPARGVKTQDRFIRPVECRGRVFTPTHDAWKHAAAALTQLLWEKAVSPNGIKRSLINDLPITAAARDHGFVLITDNLPDFEPV
jgi:predicted nucleic acid-binding protein